MNVCGCGNEIDGAGALCARCEALQTLGLGPEAGNEDIEAAYRMLVKVWHPDRFQSDAKVKAAADEKLKGINAAHAFLASPAGEGRRARPKPEEAAAPASSETKKAKRPSRPRTTEQQEFMGVTRGKGQVAAVLGYALILRALVALITLAVLGMMVWAADAMLLKSPATRGFYAEYRNDIFFTLKNAPAKAWDNVRHAFGGTKPVPATPPPSGPEVPPVAAPDAAAASPQPPATAHFPVLHVSPFNSAVTIGLTKDEVVTVLGTPSAISEQSMTYDNSVIYLLHGKVGGWKVDPSTPIRVKLTPSIPIPSSIKTFTLGSSRNEVIAVQGTPTLCTAAKFGYGTSEVFFDHGQVIGWKNDPASVQLRVSSH